MIMLTMVDRRLARCVASTTMGVADSVEILHNRMLVVQAMEMTQKFSLVRRKHYHIEVNQRQNIPAEYIAQSGWQHIRITCKRYSNGCNGVQWSLQ